MKIIRVKQQGMIALIVTIMIASFTLIYGLSVALMTIDELQTSNSWLYSAQSTAFTSSCTDNTLSTLLNNVNFTGNVNLSTSNVNCVSTVTNPGGNIRTVVSNGTSTDPFGRNVTDRTTLNVNVNTSPFTIVQYKDILE